MGLRRAKSIFLVWSRKRGRIEDWSLVGIGSDESNAKHMVDLLSQRGRVGKIQPVKCNVFQQRENLDISTPYTIDEHWAEGSDGHWRHGRNREVHGIGSNATQSPRASGRAGGEASEYFLRVPVGSDGLS